ncbi:helix-turn-helix domain-containing protein [Amycolatopsis sp. K13G38]|uniref:Helix-turn-helix domain-containing protein n=1 Tax=Amycolatopsis acididurans TaxID=2724524 RepID=A0ABX1J0I8_9PSEU|nr:helix-turn-helix domain-containing protein [Amycolatopsis acididurans]NKQ52901.1 helix-turn-helix domain-containing protein [Amycolatopsis acididurans]
MYRERPGRGVVHCWWEQRVGDAGRMQRVVPDVCSDIIVTADGTAVLVGPTTEVALHDLAPGTDFRGLRFRTEALGTTLRLRAHELRDATLPLSALLPDDVARRVAEEVWLGRFPAGLRPDPVEPRLAYAVRRLWQGVTGVAAVAEEVNVAERHLRRLFLDHTGVGPKAVQRVGRFQRFLRAGESGELNLAGLAALAGYADQAHLTREVRALTGLSPGALLRERRSPG